MGKRDNRAFEYEVVRGLRWYPIQSKPRQESTVEKRLNDLNLDVFLPWVRCRRRIGSRFQWVLEPLFPGYLFCRLDFLLSGQAVRYVPGVKDFVRFGSGVAEVEEKVINGLTERCPGGIAQTKPRLYRIGEPVLIKEGPLSGLQAIFERELKGSERVAVLLEILGRQTRLILSGEVISRL